MRCLLYQVSGRGRSGADARDLPAPKANAVARFRRSWRLDSILPPRQPELASPCCLPSADNFELLQQPDRYRAALTIRSTKMFLKEESAGLARRASRTAFLQFTTFRKTFLMEGAREHRHGHGKLSPCRPRSPCRFSRVTSRSSSRPIFKRHILQGPVPVDLPPQLYDVSLEFRILRQPTPQFGYDLAIAPTILSDFQNMSHQAYRLIGRVAGLYTYSPTLQIAGGVMATGRTDFPVMPIGGLIWTPTPDWRHEIIFPNQNWHVV